MVELSASLNLRRDCHGEAVEQWLLFCLFTLAERVMNHTVQETMSFHDILPGCESRSIRSLENSKVFFVRTSLAELSVYVKPVVVGTFADTGDRISCQIRTTKRTNLTWLRYIKFIGFYTVDI